MVVITILGIVTFAVVGATMSSRETQRKMSCRNNLKQLGLAIQNYDTTNSCLPPTGMCVDKTDLGFPCYPQFGMKPRLLPGLDMNTVYNIINMSVSDYSAPENFTVRTFQIPTFLCPSDHRSPIGSAALGGLSAPIGYSNYPNNLGTWRGNAGGVIDGPAYVLGQPSLGGVVRIAQISSADGAANTALFSEFIRGTSNITAAGAHPVYIDNLDASAGGTRSYPLDQLATNCLASKSRFLDTEGSDWMSPWCGQGGGYTHIQPPNQQPCIFSDDSTYPMDHGIIGASSKHTAHGQHGVHVTMVDGSVRWVKDKVASKPWRALGTWNGGEIIDGGAF
jgi:hypothetical protein